MIPIDWRKIRVHKKSQNSAFEELVCQLAFNETEIKNKEIFTRVEAPDGGVEAYWTLKNGNEIGWQAKFFIDGMGISQWKQIKISFEKVLDTHPLLVDYYICLPLDFSDPRVPGKKSLKDKWNEHIIKWSLYAETRNRKINFHFWGSFELTEKLTKAENNGRRYYWFNELEFSNDWFIQHLNESIAILGSRYTPKLNVQLDISKSFLGIYRSSVYKKEFIRLYNDFLVEGQKSFQSLPDEHFNDTMTALSKKIAEVKLLFNLVTYDQIRPINVPKWTNILSDILKISGTIAVKMDELDKLDKTEKIVKGIAKEDDSYFKYYTHLFGYEKRQIRDFDRNVRELYEFLIGDSTNGFNNPFILLKGEKGIGKSHLLADIALNNMKNGVPSFLLLGQNFNNYDPWVQILTKFGIKGNKEEFLGAIDALGQSQQTRVVIIIDAINEGAGIELWPDTIRGFIHAIKQYSWIGLILSIRTPYEDLIFEKAYLSENIIEVVHYGFDENEYEASKFFFKEYGIEQPKIPLLYPEFRQPLFLKLFCDGLEKAKTSTIPKEGYEGITEIMEFLINAINKELSKKNRLNYSSSLNIVSAALDLFISELILNERSSLPYADAHILLENGLAKFRLKPGILEELIREGILAKTIFWRNGKYDEGVYFPYQRYEDHFRAKYLINKYYDKSQPKKAFKKTGEIGKLFADNHTGFSNVNILEALAIQIPETTGLELYEVLPHLKNYGFFIHAVINSLQWRKSETVNKKVLLYLRPYLNNEDTFHYFLNVVLLISGKPGHYLNADFIHRFLSRITMADRDMTWTSYINNNYKYTNSVKRIIDWGWNINDKNNIGDDSILLVLC